MREVEIKVSIDNVAKIENKLVSLGVKLREAKKQHDVVYGEPHAEDNALNANWLRIRTENDSKVYFTLKRSVVGHLDSIEHEVVVDNAKELEAIILSLGFKLYSDLTKVRRSGTYNGIELCVDEVPGLGSFIEAEKLVDDHESDHDKVVEDLWALFSKLGLTKDKEVHEGYDVLERKQRGL